MYASVHNDFVLVENGCTKCECDMYGSVHNDCDDVTGQCVCKPGMVFSWKKR